VICSHIPVVKSGVSDLFSDPPLATNGAADAHTERLIDLLQTVNPSAVNNDNGEPGEFWLTCARSQPLASAS
jgi:hypothetical protein